MTIYGIDEHKNKRAINHVDQMKLSANFSLSGEEAEELNFTAPAGNYKLLGIAGFYFAVEREEWQDHLKISSVYIDDDDLNVSVRVKSDISVSGTLYVNVLYIIEDD